MSFICCRNRESCECVVEMENKKTKPAPNKPRVTRSVSDSVSKLPAPRGSVKLKLSLSSQQQSTTRTGKKSVTVTRKHSADAPLSRPTSKVVTETEIQEWPTMPNSSFTVLVRVLMAAAKWLKIVKKDFTKRPLAKALSLPTQALRSLYVLLLLLRKYNSNYNVSFSI